MLTSIVAIGTIGDALAPNVRVLAVDRPYRDGSGLFVIDHIPIAYWSRATNNYFMTMAPGTTIFVKGRLETLADIGLALVTDYLETLGLPAKKEIK